MPPHGARRTGCRRHTSIEGFRRDRPGDSFRGWLRTITRNQVRDFLRQRAQGPAAIGGSNYQALLMAIPADQDDDSLVEDQQELNSLYRRALALLQSDFESQTWTAFWRTAIDGRPVDVWPASWE